MHCFLVCASPHDDRMSQTEALIREAGLSVSTHATLAMLAADPAFAQERQPVVVLLDGQGDEAIAFAEAQTGHAFLVLVAETIAPDDYKRLARRQNADWCRWAELPRELSALAQRTAGADGVSRGAKVVSFLPSKGGVGTTTLAIEAAVHLASMPKTSMPKTSVRIAILDLNLDGGTLADMLDVQPRFDLREIAGRPERLDDQLIDIFASRHSDRLDIFASAPAAVGAADVDPQMIFAVLDLMARRYDLILLDLPNRHLPWIDNLLLGSDGVVVCGASTVPALKRLVATLTQLDRLGVGAGAVAVAVNQCETNAFGRFTRRAEIARALPSRTVMLIRQDDATVREAHNSGRALGVLSPGRRVGKDMAHIADWIGTLMGKATAAVRS